MGALPTTKETTPILARVEHETKQALIEQAREHGRSLSAEVRVLLREGLAREETTRGRSA